MTSSAVVSSPSRSQVNKAGRRLRQWVLDDPNVITPEVGAALSLVLAYRASHQSALGKATMGLRSSVKTLGCEAVISQRLKRFGAIVDKLWREPGMELARMQDIGGCRAVFPTIAELRKVEQRLRKNRPPVGYRDYIKDPRASGYRAVHMIVCYQNKAREDRLIEVQLRTRAMHDWAIAVERLAGQMHVDLKSSAGPPEILRLLGVISEAMAIEEREEVVPAALLEEMARLRLAAVPYLGETS